MELPWLCWSHWSHWSSNGSSLIFDDGRFDALLSSFPGVIQLATPSTLLAEWLLPLDTPNAAGPASANTKMDKVFKMM